MIHVLGVLIFLTSHMRVRQKLDLMKELDVEFQDKVEHEEFLEA
jgi:hypothetical protein